MTASEGPHRTMRCDLLDALVGSWRLTGRMGDAPLDQRIDARWVLEHQFFLLEATQLDAPEGAVPYRSLTYIGYVHADQRYTMHLLDTFGGAYAETLGSGRREGDSLSFEFAYPSGPFTARYDYDRERDAWRMTLGTRAEGVFVHTFAEKHLARVK